MNNYQQLAQQLLNPSQPVQQQPPGPYPGVDLKGLRQFITPASGRNVVRSAIDAVIMKSKVPNNSQPTPTHQELIDYLHAMHQASIKGFIK